MSNYCDTKDVRNILSAVDRETVDELAVASFIIKADNTINTKLSKRYTVPFVTVPPIIKDLSVDIAAFFTMRTIFVQDSQNKSDWTLELYNRAMKMLDELADGTTELLNADGSLVAVKDSEDDVHSAVKGYSPIFDIDDDKNWAPSPSRLRDIANRRANDV